MSDFTYTVSGSNATITGYTGPGGNITIPGTLDGYTVIGIGVLAFHYCTTLISVIIPNSVTSIGDLAFQGCINLSSVKFFGDAPTMGQYVFSSVSYDFKVYYLYGKVGFTTPVWQPDERNIYNSEPFYMVTYYGNGNTSGIAPVDSDTTETISYNTGFLKKIGYTFRGWNTQADGTGTHYDSGTTFGVVNQNLILYVQWKFSQLVISIY